MNPLSAVYGRAARLRRSWYTRHPHARRRLGRPVISVGNLVVGGSGKTPVVASLAELLMAHGQRPAILSRGYGRRRQSDGVVVVSDGSRVTAPVDISGDEPQMLARALPGVPVLVCADRYLAGRLAEAQFGCTVHLLDDGFQHLQLARGTDLLIVAPGDLAERLLPSGRLREPAEAGRMADAVLVPGSSDDARRVAAALGVRMAFTLATRYRPVTPLGSGSLPSNRDSARVLAVAAIARPQRFFSALRSEGWTVVREIAYPDHHWFTRRNLDSIRRAAERAHADIVITTEKDAVRIGSRAGWAALPLEVAIEPATVFTEWLFDRLVGPVLWGGPTGS
ncbi:MAG TPA: tetraacyldisaccharide 4'-kinase [Vicinamibacterales bacterium]|nr:tetraacyldisaccharide 4'-kinase [Vicinamibacterales bacterium]